MLKQALHHNWTLRHVGERIDLPAGIADRDIAATVPGCVHVDLLEAGLIDDPYLQDNESRLQWIGLQDWRYRCVFRVEEALRTQRHVELVCDGLDTVATLVLNGAEVGRSENMHHPHRFDVRSALREGDNELLVTFASPVHYARAMQAKLGDRPRTNDVYAYPWNFIRKMACNGGWDWGPRVATSGIWRAIRLEGWTGSRIASVRPLVTMATADRAVVEVHVEVLSEPGAPIDLGAALYDDRGNRLVADVADVRGNRGIIRLELANPRRWWPVGHGEQPLYELRVKLKDEQRNPIDLWQQRIGLRTVELDTTPDAIGARFVIKVNGKPIYCKGANWIPDDALFTRVDEARLRRRLTQAIDANMNMLRVWGGGTFESPEFFRLCDELGVMVWQDFLFACAAYPEEGPMPALVEAESRHAVTRLVAHPSLVIFNGCNENIWGYFDWLWRPKLEGRAWGAGYYFDLLPRLVKELAPTIPYWPGSPYSGTLAIDPQANTHGNRHVWDVWFGALGPEGYRTQPTRFASEYGFQGSCTFATLERVCDGHMELADPVLISHQRCPGGQDILKRHLDRHFGERAWTMEDWIAATQLMQARTLTTAIDFYRSIAPRNMGSLYWQLNDCWPVISWAAVDGDDRYKLLWYATREAYAPRLVTIQPLSQDDARLHVAAINDTDETWSVNLTARFVDQAGGVVEEQSLSLTAVPRSVAHSDPLRDVKAHALLIDGGPRRAWWWFEAASPQPRFEATREGDRVRVRAMTLVRELCVFPDRLGGCVTLDQAMLNLLPGEQTVVTLHGATAPGLPMLWTPPAAVTLR